MQGKYTTMQDIVKEEQGKLHDSVRVEAIQASANKAKQQTDADEFGRGMIRRLKGSKTLVTIMASFAGDEVSVIENRTGKTYRVGKDDTERFAKF